MKLYKVVNTEEEREVFRQWARDNYEPFTPIDGVWHWLVQEECTKINRNAEVTSFNEFMESIDEIEGIPPPLIGDTT